MTKSKNPVRELISQKLRDHRKKNHKSQQQMANRLGIQRPRYAAYEEKRATPPFTVICDIAKVLGMRVEELAPQKYTC